MSEWQSRCVPMNSSMRTDQTSVRICVRYTESREAATHKNALFRDMGFMRITSAQEAMSRLAYRKIGRTMNTM